jgi:hypothetical protein
MYVATTSLGLLRWYHLKVELRFLSLLQVYAEIPGSSQMALLSSLKDILQKSAKLVLMLFAQPSFWQFD